MKERWPHEWRDLRVMLVVLVSEGDRRLAEALPQIITDHQPIQMEAHHKLDQAIALDCCRAIQLAIRNADRYPNTIALELVLIDRDGPGAPSISLGREIVAL